MRRVKATGRRVFGIGNVGRVAAELVVQAGARLVVMQDHAGALVKPDCFDTASVMAALQRDGGIVNCTGGMAC